MAAGLKAEGAAHDLFSNSFFAAPRIQLASIEAEIILGAWLLSGFAAGAAWALSFGFFGILAGASLYLALNQQESCGCFGRVVVSPWLSLTPDLVIIAAIGVWRPRRQAIPPLSAWFRGAWQTILGASVLLAVLGGSFWLAVDQPADFLARLRGENVTIVPELCQLGEGKPGEERVYQVRLTNHSDRPVRVVGGTRSCACSVLHNLPITLAPGATGSLEVRVSFRGSPGIFQHSFALVTDDKAQTFIYGRFTGRVLPESGG